MAGFPNKYVYTTGNPSNVGNLQDGVGVAIKYGGPDGATADEISAFKAAHPNNPVVIWVAPVEGEAYSQTLQNAASEANQIGAAGFIAQGESADQMNAAAAVSGQVNVPKIIVTNGAYVAQWPPGWGVAFEYYPNDPSGGAPSFDSLGKFLQAVVSQGATSVQITIGSWGSQTVSMQQYQAALDYLKSQGIDVSSLSVFVWNSMSPEQQNQFLTTLGIPTTPPPSSPPAAAPPAAAPPTTTAGTTLKHPKTTTTQKPTEPQPSASDQTGHDFPYNFGGGNTEPKPQQYTGGATIVKTVWSADGKTRFDITATGAVIETTTGGTPYRVGQVDPNGVDGIYSASQLKNSLQPWGTYPTTTAAATTGAGSTGPTQEDLNSAINYFRREEAQTANAGTGGTSSGSTGSTGNIPSGASLDPGIAAALHVHEAASSGTTSTSSTGQTGSIGSIPSGANLDPGIAAAIRAHNNSSSGSSSSSSGGGGSSSGGATDGGSSGGGGSNNTSGTVQDYTPASVVPGSPGGGSCFIAGTKVLIPSGEANIEELKVGDEVLSWDMEAKKTVEAKVIETFSHQDKATLELTTEGGSVTTTGEHRFWTGSEWLPAGKLTPHASSVFDRSGKAQKVTEVKPGPTATTYHIHVSDPHHNYFAGNLLGHNMKMGQ